MTKHRDISGLNQLVENDILNYQDFSVEESSAAGVKRWAILEGLTRLPHSPAGAEPVPPLLSNNDRVNVSSARPEPLWHTERPAESVPPPQAYAAPAPPWQAHEPQPYGRAPSVPEPSQAFGHLFRRPQAQAPGQAPAGGTSLKALLKRIAS